MRNFYLAAFCWILGSGPLFADQMKAPGKNPPETKSTPPSFYAIKAAELCTRYSSKESGATDDQFLCGDMSWTGLYRGTKIKVVATQGEWASIDCPKQNEPCWLKTANLIPADHATKAAVIKESEEAPLGTLVFILKKDKDSCRVNLGPDKEVALPCAALSTENPQVQAAETVEQVHTLKGFGEFENAIHVIATAKKDPHFPFMAPLFKELPALEEGLKKLRAEESKSDYQNCFMGYSFREGEKD